MAAMYIVKKNSESAGEMGPLSGSQVRELVQNGELTAGDLIRNVNSQNWVRIDSVPQLASELGNPKSSPKNKDVDLQDSDSKPRTSFMPVCSHCGSAEVRNRWSLILSGTGRTRFSGKADAMNTVDLQAHTTVHLRGTSISKSDLVLRLENQRTFDFHEIVHVELQKLISSGKYAGETFMVTYNRCIYIEDSRKERRCTCPRCYRQNHANSSVVLNDAIKEISSLFGMIKEQFRASPKRAIGDLVRFVLVNLEVEADLEGLVDSAVDEMDRIRGYCLCCGASQ